MAETGPAPRRFGTFAGVFTPTTLTILGVILFLRFGDIMGQAGVLRGMAIVLGAQTVTLLTSFSLSAIATNTPVKGGGAYFLISRTLGVEFGGGIGLFLYLAQATSVALYVLGFTESFLGAFPSLGWDSRLVASCVNLGVFLCVFAGAGWTIRLQYGILAVLVLAVLSFFAGALPLASLHTLAANLHPAYGKGSGFFPLFALFFPAVTGIMAGVNMSGDLADPGRSIPVGTFTAIAFTGSVYVGMGLLLSAVLPQGELLSRGFVVRELALVPGLVNAGVFAATLSSALGSMMGAPRVLQAFARDRVLPRLAPFARGSGKTQEPRLATLLTFLIAQGALLLGDLDAVAPVITLFFLVTYATLNLACFLEGVTRNPSFRPRFRWHHWSLSLLGTLECLGLMAFLSPLWSLLCLLALGGTMVLIGRAEILATWGDLTSGLAFQRARASLIRLEKEKYHPKNWRPSILALSGGAWNRNHLAEYACCLASGRGVVSLAQVLLGDVETLGTHREEAERLLRKHIRENGLCAFPVVVAEEDLGRGMKTLLQCHGLGGVRPNTVLLGWSEDPKRRETFFQTLRLARRMGKSILVLRYDQTRSREEGIVPEGPLSVWWTDLQNGSLMLLLAHLLRQNPLWRDHPLRILLTPPPQADRESLVTGMQGRLEKARIDGEIEVLPTEDPEETLSRTLANPGLLLIGFAPPEEEEEEAFLARMASLLALPGDLLLVCHAGHASLEA